jgi:hypothetical protein
MHLIRKYPKLLLLLVSMIVAYAVFMAGGLHWLHGAHGASGYLAAFIGGILFTFGFTAPFGIGVFVELAPLIHPVAGSLIGACGAVLADLAIFQIMRFELFHEEIGHLKATRFFLRLHGILHHQKFPEKVREYVLWLFAGMIIASPLPDEFGVALVSSLTEIDRKKFIVLSYVFNALGVFLILEGTRLFV